MKNEKALSVSSFGKVALVAALAAALALLLVGCGESQPEAEPEPEAALVSAGVELVLEEDGEWLESYEPFYRIDVDSSTAWQEDLDNLRIITEGWYELGEAKEKYNFDPDYVVDMTGMDNLNASASAQYSEQQFRDLADTLREAADGKDIVIVDLREESHYLLNGISISYFSLHNWGNLGLDLAAVKAAEEEVFGSLEGQTITAYVEDDEEKQEDQLEITVESAMSEEELVLSEGFTYLRIDCIDHVWPEPADIDAFIEYTKSVDLDNTWFHFHCHSGSGRAGTFMLLLDKMKNPEVSDKDIMYRQAMTGSNYPLYLGDGDSYKHPLYAEKAEMAPLLFDYIEENHATNYEVSWSEWLQSR